MEILKKNWESWVEILVTNLHGCRKGSTEIGNPASPGQAGLGWTESDRDGPAGQG